MTGSRRPERRSGWAGRLLERSLPPGVRGRSIKGDLDQEHDELRARTGRNHRVWYAGESIKLAANFGTRAYFERHRGRAGMMGQIARDVRYAVRRLFKNPGFTIVAVATAAIGIGANVAIFSVVNAVLFAPLPYDDADRLVAIWEHRLPSGNDRNVANAGNVRDWRERASTFSGMAAASMPSPHIIAVQGEPEEIQAIAAEPEFFSVLGVKPALGRDLSRDGGVEVLLTHAFWMRVFGGDPAIVGQTLRVDDTAAEVVGVLPDAFLVWGDEVDLYYGSPIEGRDRTNSGRWLTVIGRLSAGSSIEGAQEEMLTVAAQLREEDPEFNAGWSVNVISLKDEVVGDTRTLMLVLFGAVGLLLLIACANVANLMLARGTGRQREMAICTSLGATGGVLGRQLLVEAGILAGLGTVLGLALAHFGSRAIVESLPVAFGLPRAEAVALDLPVLIFTASAAAFTAFLFGLLPAIQASRVPPAVVLAGEGRGPGRGSGRLRNLLVVTEVAMSMVLLAGASLLARSFSNLLAVDSGLETENVIAARIGMSGPGYEEEAARVSFVEELERSIAAIPGVEAVGGVSWLPFNGVRAGTSFWSADAPPPPTEDRRAADILNTTGDYFAAIGIEVVRGRTFDERDHAASPRVAVVNQTLAEALWPGEDPVGRELTFNWGEHETVRVVGLIADVRADGLGETVDEAIYMPMSQTPYFGWNNLVVRGGIDPTTFVSQIRQELATIDPTIPLARVQVVDDMVARSVARPRVSAFLMGVFALVAAVLAAVGLYGVLSYTVARRVREIGVRVALGAQASSVLAMIVGQGSRLIAVGLVLGLAGAFATGRLMESLLFGVAATDPLSIVLSALFLFAIGMLACLLPAVRATRVAPVRALSSD